MAHEVVQMLAFAETKDAFGAIIDQDNATCWLFQFQKGGFARCSMTDGSILFQGNIFNDPTKVLATHATATPFWAQQGSFYYVLYQTTLYKLTVGAGPVTDIGNGYLETVATLDLSGLGPFSFTGWAFSGNLLAITAQGLNALVVIETDIFELLGTFPLGTGASIIPVPFFDVGGDLWAIAALGTTVTFITWIPEDGAEGGRLSKVKTAVYELARFGWSAPAAYATYCPQQGAVLLGNRVTAFTGDVLVLGLRFQNAIAFHAADSTFFFAQSGADDATIESMLIGQLPSLGTILLGDSGDNTQVGGIYQVVNPKNLSNMVTYNVTDDIVNDAGFPVPLAVQPGRGPNPIPTPFAAFHYNYTLDRAIVTYQPSGSAAYSVVVGGGGGGSSQLQNLGLMAVRNYCQAYGIYISGVMDTQRPAKDWLEELCDIANCAPVWNGSLLDFRPRCEVSAAGNGAIYIAPTASGPKYDLDDNVFVYPTGQPPIMIHRNRPADAFNVLPIEHINRTDNYNRAITTIRNDADIYRRGAIKASTLSLLWIHDQATAVKVGWPLLRRSTIIERVTLTFKLPWMFSVLDPYDLVTLTDPILGLNKFPVRLITMKETETYDIECEAEPFYYGAHIPSPTLPGSVPITTSFNQNADPGSVNTPVILEAVARLNQFHNQGAIWITASGASPNYGGAVIFMSVDGGVTYNPTPVGTLNSNAIVGVTLADYPASLDPDNTDTLSVDISESFGQQLVNFTAAQQTAFQSLIYLAGGGNSTLNGQTLTIPYELLAYQTANLITGSQYNIVPPVRRGVYGTPPVDHPTGTQFAFIDPNVVVQVPIDPSMIGRTLFFKILAFNIFGQNQQQLTDPGVVAYQFTPTGKVGGSVLVNQNSAYTLSPAQVVFQGKSGGQPGHPSFTDPTKVYIATPFTANFASGPVVYNGPFGPTAIPASAPETLYVSVQDPQFTGTGTLFVDTNASNFNSTGFTKLGTIFIADTSTGGAIAQAAARTMYSVTPSPGPGITTFTIKAATVPNYVDVFVNGVLQDPGIHYTLLGNQIIFTQVLQAVDDIKVVF